MEMNLLSCLSGVWIWSSGSFLPEVAEVCPAGSVDSAENPWWELLKEIHTVIAPDGPRSPLVRGKGFSDSVPDAF